MSGQPAKYGIAAVGQDQRAALRLHATVVLRRARQVALAAVDEVVGVLVDPRMIRRHVVGDEVEHQLQAALAQPLAQAGQRRVAAEVAMHGVAGDREAGAGDVLVAQVGQRLLELAAPLRVARARSRCAAGPVCQTLSNQTQSKPSSRQPVELGVGDVVQRRAPAQRARRARSARRGC